MILQATDVNCLGSNQLIINQAQGDNTPIKIVFKDQDVTGWDFKGTISFPAPISLTVGNGITVVAPDVGWIQLQLTPEQTLTVPPGQYPFDLWSITDGVDPVQTDPITGYFKILETITVVS